MPVAVTAQDNVDEKNNLQPNVATEVGESSNPSVNNENPYVDPHAPDSNAEVAVDGQKSYAYSQVSEDYNQLLNQYYELEQRRQQIVDQLYRYYGWNYQYYGSGMQWTNAPTFQGHQLPVGQAFNPYTFSSCCPCVSQCCAAPSTSVPTCCLAGPCVGTCGPTDRGKSIPQEDTNIVETAMGTAERVISSLRMKIADESNMNEANKEKVNDREKGEAIQSTSSETDLTEVLSAWYSTGFYTGKYLVEQSIAKKRQS